MASIDIGSQALLIDGHTSVGRWEAECQRALARLTVGATGSKVLEVGYGLGMASAAIQGLEPSLHVVLESRSEVIIHALSVCEARHRCLFQIEWQQAHALFRHETFDAIVFDADPQVPADLGWGAPEVCEWILPAVRQLVPLLVSHGRLGFIDFTNQALAQSVFDDVLAQVGMSAQSQRQPISPPAACQYAKGTSADIVVLTSN